LTAFNEFFTRALKPGVRSIAADPDAIACPVDGVISEAGKIDGERLLQAKGRSFSLTELLAAQPWRGISKAAPLRRCISRLSTIIGYTCRCAGNFRKRYTFLAACSA